jgi:hypothetical protein
MSSQPLNRTYTVPVYETVPEVAAELAQEATGSQVQQYSRVTRSSATSEEFRELLCGWSAEQANEHSENIVDCTPDAMEDVRLSPSSSESSPKSLPPFRAASVDEIAYMPSRSPAGSVNSITAIDPALLSLTPAQPSPLTILTRLPLIPEIMETVHASFLAPNPRINPHYGRYEIPLDVQDGQYPPNLYHQHPVNDPGYHQPVAHADPRDVNYDHQMQGPPMPYNSYGVPQQFMQPMQHQYGPGYSLPTTRFEYPEPEAARTSSTPFRTDDYVHGSVYIWDSQSGSSPRSEDLSPSPGSKRPRGRPPGSGSKKPGIAQVPPYRVIKPASEPPPVVKAKAKEKFDPSKFYRALQSTPRSWGSISQATNRPLFSYNHLGELITNHTFTAAELNEFLFAHPKNGQQDCMTLWVQTCPASSKDRYNSLYSEKCRFHDCPVKGNSIHKGHFRVAFDEQFLSNPFLDPYNVAGYVHLYCLEHFLDFPAICKILNVQPDDRKLPEGRNKMAVTRDHEILYTIVERFKQKSVSLQPGAPFVYADTLCHELNEEHMALQPAVREAKRSMAGGNNLSIHRGDLHIFASNEETKQEEVKQKRKRTKARKAGKEVENEEEEEEEEKDLDDLFDERPCKRTRGQSR